MRGTSAVRWWRPSSALALALLFLWTLTAPTWPTPRESYDAFPAVTIHYAPWLWLVPHTDGWAVPGGWIFHRDRVPRPYLLAHEYAHQRQLSRYGAIALWRQYWRGRGALVELDARRDAWTLCTELPDVVPPAICGGER